MANTKFLDIGVLEQRGVWVIRTGVSEHKCVGHIGVSEHWLRSWNIGMSENRGVGTKGCRNVSEHIWVE